MDTSGCRPGRRKTLFAVPRSTQKATENQNRGAAVPHHRSYKRAAASAALARASAARMAVDVGASDTWDPNPSTSAPTAPR
mmetsp:Transcript_3135/g.7823  ORF Transcript_3135/g.7823 Transcript_3135/m.7823 type:complete len:81 (-) Transcript_3135:947-1189(-)